ncbi:membrane-bound serine protease (ClpP class) [Caldalkalibacillus uzonensis]|uniref:Membrane-bound serine protease (ClpP class) n=1 Tax=Caldalkalibacillus uzonensis TaxID=353224 RepID=A0ABU0CUR9_9BACI|nr:nodulation protein NfeD [Caldalkalibacillus uzonensis]MDQ0339634.1 membrane-bound serine protease (ClpP class) [Caldalkalibacillus uzonensis]
MVKGRNIRYPAGAWVTLFMILCTFAPLVFVPMQVLAQDDGLVYVVEVSDVVEKGLLAYMERAFREAEEAGADHIILQLHTPGGEVDAAEEIGNLIQFSSIPVTAFINTNATSAGAFIALNADQIVMAPTGTMGSAQVVHLEGQAADEKAQSHWKSRMAGAATAGGRDPIYAIAMVDPSVEIEGLVTDEQLLNFTADQALEHGYAEGIANNLQEVLQFIELENATVVEVEITWAERLARFITHPIVASILLSVASLGLILELYSPGFGVPGILGISALLLFFFGHLVAGFAGMEAVLLFIAGLILIIIELFMPGFGIFGILGIVAVGASLTLASENVIIGLQNIGIALLLTIIVAAVLSRYLHIKGVWSRLVLQEGLSTEEGRAVFEQKSALVGKTGIALTKLRPSGAVRIDGQRYDVVSDGTVIEQGAKVEVIKVEGPRIVVRELDNEDGV